MELELLAAELKIDKRWTILAAKQQAMVNSHNLQRIRHEVIASAELKVPNIETLAPQLKAISDHRRILADEWKMDWGAMKGVELAQFAGHPSINVAYNHKTLAITFCHVGDLTSGELLKFTAHMFGIITKPVEINWDNPGTGFTFQSRTGGVWRLPE